ncbi:glutamate 5-kinase [archaeon]|jgi:glutamate 5-kinase|nr:glutamate 5-kinase [archaeon]MDP6547751.1 glutamate 5-kinase [Candidatus Woesearchaeota archaeon]|tara:strand:- start:45686 stop:46510 length:825 start_codon:yes stop_codon:yes gene_type:complete
MNEVNLGKIQQYLLNQAEIYVVKIGSNILTREDKKLDSTKIYEISDQVAELIKKYDKKVIIVSSGAIATGRGIIDLKNDGEHSETVVKQSYSAIGQSSMYHEYEMHLRSYGITAGQLLLTHEDFDKKSGRLDSFKNTLELLLYNDVVPIINENDTVSNEEITFGDNDSLAAKVAVNSNADLLIMLTSVDGVYDNQRKKVPLARDVDEVKGYANPNIGTENGAGGMESKLEATQIAMNAGIPVVIANGVEHMIINELLRSKSKGTLFLPKKFKYT